MQKKESNSRVMIFSSNENRNNYYIEKYGFVPSFATRKNPKKAESDAAIRRAQQSRRNIALQHTRNTRNKKVNNLRKKLKAKRNASFKSRSILGFMQNSHSRYPRRNYRK